MIDLRADMVRVRDMLIGGVHAFGAEHPETRVSMFAVYCCPWAGWLLLSIDTKEHSDAHVAMGAPKYASRGPEWAGQDEAGQFCSNAPDFEFHGWRDLHMEHWQVEYEGLARSVIRRDGSPCAPSTANDDYNEPFFEALVSTLQEVQGHPVVAQLNLAEISRCGVQMLDSTFAKYWVHPRS